MKKIAFLSLSFLSLGCAHPTAKESLKSSLKDTLKTLGQKDSTNINKSITLNSEITCPKCNFKKSEILPHDVCVLKYSCQNCKTELRPKEGDCCVYCTYGSHKCPSMQE